MESNQRVVIRMCVRLIENGVSRDFVIPFSRGTCQRVNIFKMYEPNTIISFGIAPDTFSQVDYDRLKVMIDDEVKANYPIMLQSTINIMMQHTMPWAAPILDLLLTRETNIDLHLVKGSTFLRSHWSLIEMHLPVLAKYGLIPEDLPMRVESVVFLQMEALLRVYKCSAQSMMDRLMALPDPLGDNMVTYVHLYLSCGGTPEGAIPLIERAGLRDQFAEFFPPTIEAPFTHTVEEQQIVYRVSPGSTPGTANVECLSINGYIPAREMPVTRTETHWVFGEGTNAIQIPVQ